MTKKAKSRNKSATKPLTVRQERFVLIFATDPEENGTRAARQAGYKGDDHTLAMAAFDNLRKPEIVARIRAIRAENEKHLRIKLLESRGVLERITRHAVTSIGDVLEKDGKFDLAKARERGVDLAIKRVKFHKAEVVEIEMYDAQEALKMLGNYYGPWKRGWLVGDEDPDKVLCEMFGLTPEQLSRVKVPGLPPAPDDYNYDVDEDGDPILLKDEGEN